MSELISVELFDQFRNSRWPQQFGGMAQAASAESVAVDELGSFTAYESGLIIAPKEEQRMLEDMGIIEDQILVKNVGVPTVIREYTPKHNLSSHVWIPRFTEFGKQVISACENLYTPEDHAAASEAARPELERLIAETNAEFGIEE